MERRGSDREARERVEELENPLSRQPIGDRKERGAAPEAKVLHRTLWRRRDVPSRGDDPNLRSREPCFDQLLREMVARGDEDIGSSQREPIEWRLGRRASSAVVDAAWRLMEDGYHGHAEMPRRERRSYERSGDRVDQDGACPELLRPTKQCGATERREWERPLGKGQEDDPCLIRRRFLRHSQVVQVPPAQPTGIA